MKKKIIVLYGGQSTEYEISCRSASFVLSNIDEKLFEVCAIGITKEGQWIAQNPERLLAATKDRSPKTLPIFPDDRSVATAWFKRFRKLLDFSEVSSNELKKEYVLFPVTHGSHGEDGHLQGFLDLLDLAYVGPGVLGSSMSMDKVVAKQRVASVGINVVDGCDIRIDEWRKDPTMFVNRCMRELGEAVYIKPASLGSSVGVSPAKGFDQCLNACEEAFKYDERVLVEKKMNAREIECAALGGYIPEISLPGEVQVHSEFYSYKSKYQDPEASTIKVPAELSEQMISTVRDLSKKAFMALELYGMSRIDFFLCKDSKEFYFNEANTIPGFTDISQYPQLWRCSGKEGKELVSELIHLAELRQQTKTSLQRAFL